MAEPAEAFPLSSFVSEEMSERGWSRDDLLRMSGWTVAALDALLVQDAPLTDDQAADLERMFGVSQRFWLNLELTYRRWKQARNREGHATRQRGRRATGGQDG